MAKRGKDIKKQAKKDWNSLGEEARIAIIATAAVEITLLVIAQLELVTSKKERIRGKKWLWFLANFINFLGPISFLLLGRRRSPGA